jgi:hypothetical protein
MSHNRIDAHRPVATKVIDGDSYTVELDLSPIAAGLLSDIALALRGNGHLMTLLANNKVGSLEHTRLRRAILQRLEMTSALKLTLGPDQAEQLAGDLFDAMEEPARCEGACGGENYAVYDGLCVDDDAARSLANASAGGRL